MSASPDDASEVDTLPTHGGLCSSVAATMPPRTLADQVVDRLTKVLRIHNWSDSWKNYRPCHRWHHDGNKCRTPSAKFDVCIEDTKILISSECEDQANSRLGILSSNIDWCKFYKIASERFFSSWPLSRISWQIATSYFNKSSSSTKTMIDQYLLKSRCIKPSSTPGIRTRNKWVTDQEIGIYTTLMIRW